MAVFTNQSLTWTDRRQPGGYFTARQQQLPWSFSCRQRKLDSVVSAVKKCTVTQLSQRRSCTARTKMLHAVLRTWRDHSAAGVLLSAEFYILPKGRYHKQHDTITYFQSEWLNTHHAVKRKHILKLWIKNIYQRHRSHSSESKCILEAHREKTRSLSTCVDLWTSAGSSQNIQQGSKKICGRTKDTNQQINSF